MGDLSLINDVKTAKQEVIDPRFFGISVKNENHGQRMYYTFKPTFYNGVMLLSKHPKYEGKIKYCTFESSIHVDGKQIDNNTVFDVMLWIGGTYMVNYKKEMINDIISKIAKDHEYNSFLHRLNDKQWDGEPRIDDFLYKYLGVSLDYHTADDINEAEKENNNKLALQMDKENYMRTKLMRAYIISQQF